MVRRFADTFRGWKIATAGSVVQAVQSALLLLTFGNYAVLLEREFGWTKTTLSAAFSLQRAETGLLGPVQGWALDRYGPRRIMRLGASIMAIGFLLFSQTQQLWHFFVFFIIIAVGGSLAGYMTITTAVVPWFERKRARALGLASIGFAVGGVMVPIVVWTMNEFGWRWTAAGSGVAVLVLLWPLSSLLGGTPADFGTYVDGIDPAALGPDVARAEGVSDVSFTAKEALRTSSFWFIALGHMSAVLVVSTVLAHLSLYLTSDRGYSLQEASFIAAALPIMQLVGVVLGGWIGDRANKRLIASVAMAGHVGGLLLLAYASDAVMIWLFALTHGLAWGVRGPLMQALRADYFGTGSYGQIMGLSTLVVMIGSIGGPLMVGMVTDATGNYRLGFTIVAIIAGLGTTIFMIASPPELPDRTG